MLLTLVISGKSNFRFNFAGISSSEDMSSKVGLLSCPFGMTLSFVFRMFCATLKRHYTMPLSMSLDNIGGKVARKRVVEFGAMPSESLSKRGMRGTRRMFGSTGRRGKKRE